MVAVLPTHASWGPPHCLPCAWFLCAVIVCDSSNSKKSSEISEYRSQNRVDRSVQGAWQILQRVSDIGKNGSA
jgi:hypothetical protein